jgi:cytochrome c-type biogenesis protein CcmH/NrfG
LCEGRIAVAESLLREHLKQNPTDVAAIRMLAEVAARLGRYGDAESLLHRCLELMPSFHAARHNYAVVLHRSNKASEALREIDRLLETEPQNPSYRNLQAAVLSRLGETGQSIEVYAKVLAEYPRQAKVWMSYGHALKTAGRQADSVDAYRKSIELEPKLGESYWSLANLKTHRFGAADVTGMRAQLARSDLTDDDRLHFHFALGKALEDAGAYADSFGHYSQGNALRRAQFPYDAAENHSSMQRWKALFKADFFAQRRDFGCTNADPIFIVGMPRAGSTLLEQILSSHSAIEGTMELPDIISIAQALGERKTRNQVSKYPEVLANLSQEKCRALGEQYVADTRIQRKTAKPFFVDKMPNNFAHIGLIQLILPRAKIVDARRHPLGCGFSVFKQHFARGQNWAYSLEDIGAYYRDYVDLMAHFDEVLPGRIHRVIYENMVEDTEKEVTRLLDYLGLPFESACLRFFENERTVRTASSEQVRQRIYREGVDQWRRFEAGLDPLKSILGSVLDQYVNLAKF